MSISEFRLTARVRQPCVVVKIHGGATFTDAVIEDDRWVGNDRDRSLLATSRSAVLLRTVTHYDHRAES